MPVPEVQAAAGVGLRWMGAVAYVTLSNPSRFNAMTLGMWRDLKAAFESISAAPNGRCVVLQGEGSHFCSGGDISEYPAFRFEETSLRAFHEDVVWGALDAILACDLPVVALIRGNCMGAGVELACCCDMRLATEEARFGAPIGKLGFPMAPREAQLVASVLGEPFARAMLLGAQVLDAQRLHQSGFLLGIGSASHIESEAALLTDRVLSLAPQAARLNKQTLRALGSGLSDGLLADAYRYANTPEHREGVTAFLAKRSPQFGA